MTSSARLGLPHILVNQSQKEVTHNQALDLLDLLVHPVIETATLADPPATPFDGQAWIVAAPAGGAWADMEGMVAARVAGAWLFLQPFEGFEAWLRDRGLATRFDGNGWIEGELRGDRLVLSGQQVVGARRPAITEPAAGTTIDAEARAAIGAILAALRDHGLIEP